MSDTEEDPDGRIHKLVNNARHDSVTAPVLTNKKQNRVSHRVNDHPLRTYIRQGEQPHFILYANRKMPEFYGPDAPDELNSSLRYSIFHILTDQRILMVAGNKNGDQTFSVPLSKMRATNHKEKTVGGHVFVFETGTLYAKIHVSSDFDWADLRKFEAYLEERANVERQSLALDTDSAGYTIDGVDHYQPNIEDIQTLFERVPASAKEQADEIVAQAEDAEEVAVKLNELIDEHESEDKSLDDLVAEADGVSELRAEIDRPDDESNTGRIRQQAEGGARVAASVARNSDPNVARKWAMEAAKGALPFATAVPYSTPLLLAGAIVVGGGVGAYASGREETVLNEVDPTELRQHVEAMANRGSEMEINSLDGKTIGAILGATSYLGVRMTPEEYAKWVQEAEPEAIMAGIEASVEADTGWDSHESHDAVLGGLFGLAHNYAGGEQSIEGDLENFSELKPTTEE